MGFKYTLIGEPLGFSNVLDSILKNRGIENVNSFLNPTDKNIEDELLYDNMNVVFNKIIVHLRSNSEITILVDPDADGYTSAALMYQYLILLIDICNSQSSVKYVIRDDKGHGLTDNRIIKEILTTKCDLLIIPDASSNDYKQHKWFHRINTDMIILDHHECEYHSKYALVINNQLSKRVTNKTLTGVGVVYKLCKYIDKQLDINIADEFLDLVAIGLIGDSSDLRNLESRYLVLCGLHQIELGRNTNELITAMIKEKKQSLNNEVTIIGMAFYIIPLINSIIRNGTYEEKQLLFKAFINSDESFIVKGKGKVELSIQEHVIGIANECKNKQTDIIDDGIEILNNQIQQYRLNDNGILIVNGNEVDKNYTGVIANKLAGLYQKPCLVLREDKDNYSGSGRGFERKDIKDFKQWCKDTNLFEFVEGHSNAFGIKIHKDNINKLYEYVRNINLSNELNYDVDGIFNFLSLNNTIIDVVAKHKYIWGTTLYEPLFAIENIVINTKDITLIGKNKNTIKMKYKNIELIKFKTTEENYKEISKHEAISITIVGKFTLNEFLGKITSQIIIEDMMYLPTVAKFRF